MFDGFDKLPILIQYAIAIGGGFGASVIIIWRLIASGRSAPPSPDLDLSHQLVAKAAELADMKVRDDLKEIIRIAREAMEQRMDQAFSQMSAKITLVETVGNDDRRDIHTRIDDVIKKQAEDRLILERLRTRRSRP